MLPSSHNDVKNNNLALTHISWRQRKMIYNKNSTTFLGSILWKPFMRPLAQDDLQVTFGILKLVLNCVFHLEFNCWLNSNMLAANGVYERRPEAAGIVQLQEWINVGPWTEFASKNPSDSEKSTRENPHEKLQIHLLLKTLLQVKH